MEPTSPEQVPRRSSGHKGMYPIRLYHETHSPSVFRNFDTPATDIVTTLRKLNEISRWPENWNEHGAASPNIAALLVAKDWIEKLRADVFADNQPWREPHVVPDMDGDIVFEWSINGRTLAAYIYTHTIEYLLVSGPDMENDMIEGVIEKPEDNQHIWRWLMGKA